MTNMKPDPQMDGPWVLGLNTATETLSVALARGGEVHAELYVRPTGSRGHHAEKLMGAIEALVRMAGLAPADLAAIAVAIGPGGFTGVRTALAAAKGIALALAKPLIGISTLEALADQAPELGLVASMIDARRQDVFAALYRKHAEGLDVLLAPELMSLDSWLDRLEPYRKEEALTCIGDGATPHVKPIAERGLKTIYPLEGNLLRAGAVARLGARRLEAGDYEAAIGLLPAYLRSPSAVPNWAPLVPPGGSR